MEKIQNNLVEYTKPTLEEVYELREWMPFSDQEKSIFQYCFMDYFLENENKLSKKDVYKLACLANETQYQMRILAARISKEKNLDELSNNRFIKILLSFEGLIEFVKNRIIKYFEETSAENKYNIINSYYSFFTATDEVKDLIKKDFDLYFST